MKTKCVTALVLCFIFLFFSIKGYSQSTLLPGDIAFVGFNAKDLDSFSFIALTKIPANSEIYFTDNGWKASNTFRTGEGIIKWTSPMDEVLPGTVIAFGLNGGWKSSIGTVTITKSIELAIAGDQILAYQVSTSSTFIAAIHFGGTSWNSDATETYESKLPRGLTNLTAVAIGDFDNAIYSGDFEGEKDVILAKIMNKSNWYSDDHNRLPMSPGDFPCNVWKVDIADWNTPSNWFTGTVPNEQFHVYIPPSKNPVIISATDVVCKKLTVGNNASVTVKSDVNGTGSLITDAADISGAVNVERYIPSANWHLISSPVSGQGLAAFSAVVNNNIGKYTAPTPDEYDLASYLENNDTWSYVKVGGVGNFVPGTGYSMHRNAAGTVSFSGNGIYTGNLTVPITCDATTNGWNCIGNPYTSGLKSRYFLSVNRPNLDPLYTAVYRWEESSSTYIPINFTTTGPDTIIAVGQGFFVNSKEVASNSVTFTSAMQTTGAATFKSSEIPGPTIKLIAQAEGLSNTTTVTFDSEMTRGLDPGFDAGILRGNPNIALYTRLLEDNGIDFAIQALPELTDEQVRIPVGLDFFPGGEMSFMVETTAFPAETQVYFEDLHAKTTTLLNAEDAKYTVTLPAETNGTGRFNLLVTKSATGIKAVAENLFNIYISGNTITINGPATSDTEFSLYSIDGKQWMSRRAENMNRNTIDASGFPAGIYMLNIRHQETRIAKKLVLTK